MTNNNMEKLFNEFCDDQDKRYSAYLNEELKLDMFHSFYGITNAFLKVEYGILDKTLENALLWKRSGKKKFKPFKKPLLCHHNWKTEKIMGSLFTSKKEIKKCTACGISSYRPIRFLAYILRK